MEDILKEIKNVPAVMGSYIHVSGVTKLNSDLPKIFLSKIYEVGEAIERAIKVNEATKMHANNIEFKYDEAVIIVRPIAAGASLVTFCETTINKKTLNMTTGMLANELKQAAAEIKKGGQSKPAATPPPPPPKQEVTPPPPAKAAESKVDVNKILHAGPLAKVFLDFQCAQFDDLFFQGMKDRQGFAVVIGRQLFYRLANFPIAQRPRQACHFMIHTAWVYLAIFDEILEHR